MHTEKRHVGFITILMLAAVLFAAALYNPLNVRAADTNEKAVTAKIPVLCEEVKSDETYTYKIDGEVSEFAKVSEETISLKSGEKGYFEISFNYPGTYSYTVSQIAGTDEKTTYDAATYNVDVYVTETDDGVLFAQPILYKSGSDEKKAELNFKNIRQVETPDNGSAGIDKTGKVNTGDSANLPMWGAIIAVCAVVLILSIALKNKKEKREHK